MPNTDKVLAELLAKFGVSMDVLWPRLLAFVKYDWIISQVALTLVLLLFVPLAIFLGKKTNEDYEHEELYFGGCIISSIIVFIAAIGWCISLSSMSVLWFPEPYALKYLMGLK